MSLKDKMLERSKRVFQAPSVMRWVSDDRVMRAAEGMMDARSRFRAAWRALVDGHKLPNIDPALDDLPGDGEKANGNGQASEAPRRRRTNGSSAAVAAPIKLSGSSDMDESLKERTSLAALGGQDVFEKCFKFMAADNARKMGVYPFFRPLDFNDGPGGASSTAGAS